MKSFRPPEAEAFLCNECQNFDVLEEKIVKRQKYHQQKLGH